MNYEELKIALADTLMRADLMGAIPAWIAQAEESFDQALRIPELVEHDRLPLWSAAADLPDDYLEAYSVNADGRRLAFVSMHQFRTRQGQPTQFSIFGRTLQLDAPGPRDVDLHYYRRVPRLSDTRPTNRVLEHHPSLYLYGSLLHSAPYLREDERILVWQGLYQQHLEQANLQSERGQYGPAPRVRARSIG